jgi:site-specific recombinase XerD
MARITKGTVERSHPKAKPYEIRGRHGLILRVQPSGKKTFYVQIRRGKRERIGDAEIVTLGRAEYRAREILNQEQDGGAIKQDPQKSKLGGFIEAVYAPWLKANRRRAEKTLEDLQRIKRGFEDLYEKKLTVIDGDDLDDYVAARREDGISAATIARDLTNLQSVMRLAVEKRYLRDSPFKGWRKPKPEDNGVTRYLEADEEERLRKGLEERDDKNRRGRESANKWRAERGYEQLPAMGKSEYSDHLTPMVLVSLNTGLRYGELAGLEWPAINFRAKILTVTGRTAKGAKTRHIPLNGEALEVLRRWRGQGKGAGLVFANPDGSRIASVKTAWLRLLKDARIKDFRWHDLRHSFASKLVQRGVDLAVVRELLGHGDFALTLRYAHLKPGQKEDAVARLAA